jgi:hypothetical protein
MAGTPRAARNPESMSRAVVENVGHIAPEQTIDFFSKISGKPDDAERLSESPLRRAMRTYAKDFENAYVRTRATGSISQMLSYDPADFGMMSEEVLGFDLEATQGYAARAAQTQRRIEEAERLARNQVRSEDNKSNIAQSMFSAFVGFLGGLSPIPLPGVDVPEFGSKEAEDQDVRLRRTAEEQYAKLFEDYRAQVEGRAEVPNTPNWGAIAMRGLTGVVGLLGQTPRVIDFTMRQAEKIPASVLLGPVALQADLLFGREDAPTPEQQVTNEQFNEQFNENLAVMADVQFEQLDPANQAALLEFAGGDYMLATSFLIDGFLGNKENMDEVQQLRQNAFDVEQDVLLTSLNENQFRADYSALDLLDDWGRLTAGAAIGVSLLLSDEDMRQMAGDGEFRNILAEIAEYDAKPSAVWGYEDTFLGLGIDFAMMTIFDPTTWLFAPAKGAASLRQFAKADNIMALAGSRTGKQVFEETVRLTQRGGRAMLDSTEWMPDNQMMQFWRAVKADDIPKANEIYTQAMLAGGRPGQVGNLMWSQYMGNVIKHTLDDPNNDVVQVAQRFLNQVSNRSSVELYGASMTNDVLETFASLFADDLTKFDAFADEFMAIATETSMKHSDELDSLRQLTGELHEEVSLYQTLAEGNIRPLVEGFSVGGQTYDDLDSVIGFLAQKAGSASPEDGARLFEQRSLLEGMKRRIDGRPPEDVKALAQYSGMGSDDFARQFGGQDIQAIPALPAPGKADGVGRVFMTDDGRQLKIPLYRDEQLVGRVVLDYDDTDQLVNFSIATDKAHKGDGLTLYRAAQKAEPQLDAYWLARNTEKLAPEMSDDGARFIQSVMRKEAQAVGQSVEARRLLAAKMPRLKKASAALQKEITAMGDLSQRRRMGQVILKTYDDFARSDPVLSRIPGLIDDKGKVHWEVLRSNARWRRGQQRRIDPSAGADLPGPIKKVLTPNLDGLSVNLPISPIDLQVARSIYGRILTGNYRGTNWASKQFAEQWNGWLRVKLQDSAGKWYEASRRFFMLDKVTRPATAAVAHLDEFYRINHDYGVRGLAKWAERSAARSVNAVDYALNRLTRGHVNLGPVQDIAQRRLTRFLQGVPQEVNARQMTLTQATGEVFMNVQPGSYEHIASARGLTNFFLEDAGFIQWRQGNFESWWDSAGNWMKNEMVQDHVLKVARPMTKADAIQNYENVWGWLLSNAKNKTRTTQAWDDAVKLSAERGRSVGLPGYVLRELGPIPGWGKDPQAFHAFQGFQSVMDDMFLQPQAGRQQLIAELERTQELKRLESLMRSQGYRIVEPDQMDQLALQLGFPAPLSRAHAGFLDERLTAAKVIPRSYLENLADRQATRSIDRIMYQWHLSSPAGQAARHVAPFGKPFADMWRYYINSVVSKPILRGHFISPNKTRLSSWTDQALRHYPVGVLPNRTTALMSRVAALDLELENQNINFRIPWPLSAAFGDDVNIQGIDLGPATFLPHKGENPFFSLLPGLGIIPTNLIDQFVPDANTDPENFTAFDKWMKEELPAFLPQQEFGAASPVGRLLGGGWVSSAMRMMAALGLRTNGGFPAPWSLMEFIGDTQGSTQAVRSIKTTLGSQEAWDELLAYGSAGLSEKDLINQLMGAFVYTSLEDAGEALLQKTILRQIVPSRFNTDPTLEDIEEIWLEAGTVFPQLLNDRDREALEARPQDEQIRANAAASIRTAFYDLPVKERDLLILQHPAFVPQLVSGWTWNTLKIDEIPDIEASTPFQHFPGNVGEDKFNQYKKLGWLIPRPAKDVLLSAVGYYFVVQDRAARNAFSESVQWIMENRPEDAAFLNDGDPLNDQWRSNNVIEGPGGFPAYIREYVFTVPAAEMSEEARILGIDLGESFTGEQLILAIQEKLATNRENPLHSLTVGRYLNEADFRGAAQDQALSQIAMVSPGDDSYPDQWVDYARSLQDDMRVASQFYKDVREDPAIQEDINTLRDSYAYMAHTYPGFAWETTWNQAFADDFGVWPDDWEPPVPPTGHPREAGGFQPYVWNVVDGDSLEISQNASQGVVFSPQMLPGPERRVGETQMRPEAYGARIIGLRAVEYSLQPDEAERQHREMFNKLQSAPPGSIWLVPDDRFPEVDQFGRRLVWLWVNGEYIFDPEAFLPTDDVAFDMAGR